MLNIKTHEGGNMEVDIYGVKRKIVYSYARDGCD